MSENARIRAHEESRRNRRNQPSLAIAATHFERTVGRCYNSRVPHGSSASAVLLRGIPPSESAQCTAKTAVRRFVNRAVRTEMWAGSGQVAQVVERSPEKAGVGGSTPSLATIILKNLAAFDRNSQPTIQPTIRRFDPRFLTEPSP